MSNIKYEIINTGSDGNATVIDGKILIDCGVSYKSVEPFIKDLRLVLLTHEHGDHFNRSTIKRLAFERPSLRFGSGKWLTGKLIKSGVDVTKIDVLTADRQYDYGICKVVPFEVPHNVRNQGYKLFLPEGKMIYVTDCSTLSGIVAPDYDLYMVEANYKLHEIQDRIAAKKALGMYAYEEQSIKNHLSQEDCDNFIYSNIGAKGEYIYMHQHKEKEADSWRAE